MGGIISGMLIAWILTWFKVDRIIIQGVWELFRMHIGIAGYYVIFAIAGLLTELLVNRK